MLLVARVNLRVYFRKIFGPEQRLKQNLAENYFKQNLAHDLAQYLTTYVITVLQENIKQ